MTEMAATTLAGKPSAATAIFAMCVFQKANGGNHTAWWFAMLSGERVPVPKQ